MFTVRCALILVASTAGAAGLLRPGHPAGPAEWGREFRGVRLPPNDFTGDDFASMVLSADTLGADVEVAVHESKPSIADTVCKSYSLPSPFLRQGEGGAGVSSRATSDDGGRASFNISWTLNGTAVLNGSAAVDAHEIVMLGRELKLVCFGSTWNGDRCHQVVNAIRHFTWARLMESTAGVSTFMHLRAHRAVPQVKRFKQGGGVAANVPCRSDGGKAHLFYRHIFKDGGLAISSNLALISNERPMTFIDSNWKTHHLCDRYAAGKNTMSPKPVLFTFVREPMGKFIAGYKEIASRGLIDDFRGTKVGTVEHARLFLDNVFHGSCDNGHVLLQIQNMFGPACESRFDYIGRLEKFVEHWHKLGRGAGCTEDLEWPSNPHHKSDDNDKGAEAAMREALAADGGKLARALCIWLLPDYAAFDYPLPEQCKVHADLIQTVGSL